MTEIIYEYVVEGRSMQSIAEDFGNMNAGKISNALKPYHFGGKENKTGNSNFQGGFYKGRYKHGYVDRRGNRDSNIEITWDVLSGYVMENYYEDNKETLEDYLYKQYGDVEYEDDEEEEYDENRCEEYSDSIGSAFLGFIRALSGGKSENRKENGFNRGSLGDGFTAWWHSLTRRQKIITIVVAVLVVMFLFFRDTFWSLVYAIVPTIGTLAIVFFVIKWLMTGDFRIDKKSGRKSNIGRNRKKSNIQFEPSAGGFIWFAIMAYIAIGGLKNGGSPIAALLIGAFGVLGLIKTKK